MRSRLAALAATAIFALAFSASPALADSDAGGRNLSCAGGSIDPGIYASIKITGVCTVDAGSITVRHDLVVKSGAVLLAWYGGSDVTVRHDLRVEKNGVLVLGCGLPSSVCFDDPAYNDPGVYPTFAAVGTVGHDLKADEALAVIVHHSSVGHDVSQHGGGGGLTCDPVMLGSPAFSTYEDTTIGGSASISGVRTCWLGFLMNPVGHNVRFADNATLDTDGNEIATNTIRGNLRCADNDPAPQLGDSGLGLNVIGNRATGQCAGLKS
jgi:hypothetical protein